MRFLQFHRDVCVFLRARIVPRYLFLHVWRFLGKVEEKSCLRLATLSLLFPFLGRLEFKCDFWVLMCFYAFEWNSLRFPRCALYCFKKTSIFSSLPTCFQLRFEYTYFGPSNTLFTCAYALFNETPSNMS